MNDITTAAAAFVVMLVCILLAMGCNAQDWRKLDYQGVSYVAMPRADLDTIYAMRIGKNVAARKCAALLNDRNDEIAGLQKALSASERSRKDSDGANDILREANTILIARNDKLALKAKRRGKVVAVALPICLASIGLHVLR